MKMIWAPSHVMREGRDLNQQGQAGRQEHASSNSPSTFHGVFDSAAAALTIANGATAHVTTNIITWVKFRLIGFFGLRFVIRLTELNRVPYQPVKSEIFSGVEPFGSL